jgi:hypothetical protein
MHRSKETTSRVFGRCKKAAILAVAVAACGVSSSHWAKADDVGGQWISRQALERDGVAILSLDDSSTPARFVLDVPGAPKEEFAADGPLGQSALMHIRPLSKDARAQDVYGFVWVDMGPSDANEVFGFPAYAVPPSALTGYSRLAPQLGCVVVDPR